MKRWMWIALGVAALYVFWRGAAMAATSNGRSRFISPVSNALGLDRNTSNPFVTKL